MGWETLGPWGILAAFLGIWITAWFSGRLKTRQEYLDMREQMQARITDKNEQIKDLREAVELWRKTAAERDEQVKILLGSRTEAKR